MVRCPSCGTDSVPAATCPRCGNPLPAHAPAPPVSAPLGGPTVVERWGALPVVPRNLGAGLAGVGAFWLAGAMALAAPWWPYLPGGVAMLLVAGALILGAGLGLSFGQPWAWGLSWALVAGGAAYAVVGLARGYLSGILGLVIWAALAYALARPDVRAHCKVA